MFAAALIRPTFIVVMRLLVGLTLVFGGSLKLGDLNGFAKLVNQYRVLPPFASTLLGRALPIIEILLGTGIILSLAEPWVSLSGSLLFILFSAAVAVNLLRKRSHLPCGCFGARNRQQLSSSIIYRNSAFAAAGLYSALPIPPHVHLSSVITGHQLYVAICIAGAVTTLVVCSATRSVLTIQTSGYRHNYHLN
jgi:uncharacterized membrane protein YphA (DoxX/SURF4 family)